VKCDFCGWEINDGMDASGEHHVTVELGNELRYYQLPIQNRGWRWVACAHCARKMFEAMQRTVEATAVRLKRQVTPGAREG
jgi:hypothetical protein